MSYFSLFTFQHVPLWLCEQGIENGKERKERITLHYSCVRTIGCTLMCSSDRQNPYIDDRQINYSIVNGQGCEDGLFLH